MAYVPNKKPTAPANNAPQAPSGGQDNAQKGKVEIAGRITAKGADAAPTDKSEHVCNLFKNEKNGKVYYSGKSEDGTRFTIFIN
jgi:hypothetical protein